MRIQICELRLNILLRARRWWCKAGEMRENMKYLINMCSHAKTFIEQFIRNQQRIIQFFIPAISQLRCWDTIIPDQSNPRSTIWWSSTESYWDLIATSSRVTWAVLRWLRLETGWQTTPAHHTINIVSYHHHHNHQSARCYQTCYSNNSSSCRSHRELILPCQIWNTNISGLIFSYS